VPPPPVAETTEKQPLVEARDPASILAAIEEASASVVPSQVLALFLAPIREMMVLPPEERDPKALLVALNHVEDLLTAFFLCGPPKPEGT